MAKRSKGKAEGGAAPDEPVDFDELEPEFDEMLERMHTPRHAAATHALFGMSEDELGEAAARATSELPEEGR